MVRGGGPNAPNRPPLHRNECFTRQLAQRDERIKELENAATLRLNLAQQERIKELEAQLTALKPVVRAAMELVDVQMATGAPHDALHRLIVIVRALCPEARKAMGVEP